MEDVSLVEMDSDESLKLSPLNLGEVLRCHVDEGIENVKEDLISRAHDFLIGASICKGDLCVSGPNELNTKDPNLCAYYIMDNYPL